MENVRLGKYDNSWYRTGRNVFVRILWYFVSVFIFQSYLFPFNTIKVFLLRIFGAEVGHGVIIKPSVLIKFPWRLGIGDHSWIGEKVWIDNLADVEIGNNVCISQGAMLLTGSHDYKKSTFDLIVSKIKLEDGVWIGARSIVCPGVTCASHSVLTVQSVASANLAPYAIYSGYPAKEVRKRVIS